VLLARWFYRIPRRVDGSLLACSLAGSPHESLAHRLARSLLVDSSAGKLAKFAGSSVLAISGSLDHCLFGVLGGWLTGWATEAGGQKT
jgi:hypothetical protein